MNRMCVETRGICNWRERLAKPDRQWRRGYSAFETASSSRKERPATLPGYRNQSLTCSEEASLGNQTSCLPLRSTKFRLMVEGRISMRRVGLL